MKVKLYVDSSDPYCGMVEGIMKSNNINYKRIEVSRNENRMKELKGISGQSSVPVLVVDGKVYVGFDHELIRKVFNLKNKTEV